MKFNWSSFYQLQFTVFFTSIVFAELYMQAKYVNEKKRLSWQFDFQLQDELWICNFVINLIWRILTVQTYFDQIVAIKPLFSTFYAYVVLEKLADAFLFYINQTCSTQCPFDDSTRCREPFLRWGWRWQHPLWLQKFMSFKIKRLRDRNSI